MENLIPFFIVLLAAWFASQLFRRLHVPWVIGLLVAGIIIGPHGLGIFEADVTVEFFAEIGLIFLMFMVGLEIKLSTLATLKRQIASITIINGGIPFLVGIFIGYLFKFDFLTSMFLGTIFISSSVAVIVPQLEARGLMKHRVGKLIIGSSIIEDIASLVVLSLLIQNISPQTTLPLPIFYMLAISAVFVLRFIIVKLHSKLSFTSLEGDIFQSEIRTIFAVLIGIVVLFGFLGLHPIAAAFFAGLILSGSITGDVLRDGLRAISYGLFIPIFFIVMGTKTELSVLTEIGSATAITFAVVVGSVISKFGSGYLAGKFNSLSQRESLLIGATQVPQLTTTLAVAFAGLELGILSKDIFVAMIVLSIVTTFSSPILMNWILRRGVFSGFEEKSVSDYID